MLKNWFHRIGKAKYYWLIWALLVFAWLYLVSMHLGEYAYKYPVIQDYQALFLKTIPNVLLPLLPLVVAFFCLKHDKKVISIICGCVFLIGVPWVFRSIAGELLYSPSIYSYTENTKNYGQYDEEVSQDIALNGKGYLPEAIPSEAQNVQYCYLYEKASADTLYISVSWTGTDDDMQKLQTEHATDAWEMLEDGRKIMYLSEKTLPTDMLQPHFHAVIVYDETNNVITHILTTHRERLSGDNGTVLLSPKEAK